MRNLNRREDARRGWVHLFRWAVLVTSIAALTITLPAAVPAQETFTSPGKAVQSLIAAVKDNNTNQLTLIFGPQSRELLASGDPVADANDRQRILDKYKEMHRLVTEPDQSVTLYMGAENWPFPVPLVNRNGAWMFDTAAGKDEVLFRRIGRNEFATIDVLEELVGAQKEYASKPRDGDVKQYAQQIRSDDGKQNGLYWEAGKGEPQSPVGPYLATASKGYQTAVKEHEGPIPFNGYYYRILTSQGKAAPGGAMNYLTNGKMTRGFAFVAYPATYKNSGVVTFIVGKDGKVYEKNLGDRTASIASAMTQFNPDKSWTLAE